MSEIYKTIQLPKNFNYEGNKKYQLRWINKKEFKLNEVIAGSIAEAFNLIGAWKNDEVVIMGAKRMLSNEEYNDLDIDMSAGMINNYEDHEEVLYSLQYEDVDYLNAMAEFKKSVRGIEVSIYDEYNDGYISILNI